jgi:hypothetical protein
MGAEDLAFVAIRWRVLLEEASFVESKGTPTYTSQNLEVRRASNNSIGAMTMAHSKRQKVNRQKDEIYDGVPPRIKHRETDASKP